MKTCISLLFIIFTTYFSFSQIQGGGGELQSKKNQLSQLNIETAVFQKPNIKQLQIEDEINDVEQTGPWRFGYNNETSLTLQNSGSWFQLDNGGMIWLLTIECIEANTINLTFEHTEIPKGNELYVYNEDKSFILGKFTEDHLYEGQLGTELIPGSSITVEYYVAPENKSNIGQVEIATVTHGYRTASEFIEKAFGGSGSCNININCPEAISYSDQKRGVVMLVSGSNGFCSGSLINNTAYDGKPYVLTANHCYSSPTSWVFRFNWESADCTNPGTSPSFTSLSGAVLRSRRTPTDFCLVEITGGLESGTVPSSFNAHFSGWDKTGIIPDNVVCIHHPRGDIKKISFDDDAPLIAQSTIGGVTSQEEGVWKVQWDRNTTTEVASSGSSLFDHNKRIIGQLWGGAASCSNPSGYDFYGRLAKSWNPVGSDSSNQLEYWLDPSGTGAIVVDGYEPGITVSNDGAIIYADDTIKGTLCSTNATPRFVISNLGQTTMTSATISYGYDGLFNQNYNWVGNLSFLQNEEVTLPSSTLLGGNHTFNAVISSVNGGADEVADNDSISSSFYVMENPESIYLNLNLDCYASETSWELRNATNDLLYKSPSYVNGDEGLKNYTFCLNEEGCYTFKIFDQYADGMSGCTSGNGSFQIQNSSSVVLTELAQANANFGASYTATFCLAENSLKSISNQTIEVYPNPTNGTIYWNSNDVIQTTVFNIHGKEVETLSFINDKKLTLNQLTNGVYWIEFKLINGASTRSKIVLTKR